MVCVWCMCVVCMWCVVCVVCVVCVCCVCVFFKCGFLGFFFECVFEKFTRNFVALRNFVAPA